MIKFTHKRSLVCLGIFFLFLFFMGQTYFMQKKYEVPDYTETEILRFHIRAENNTDIEQRQKEEIRDGILAYIQREMEPMSEKADVKKWILKRRHEIAERIQKNDPTIKQVGIYASKEFFPMRKYGSQVLPAGYYEAIRMDLGKGKGRNWWCICYPGFCLIDEEHMWISPKTEKSIEDSLSQKTDIVIWKSWLYEAFKRAVSLDKAKSSQQEDPEGQTD